jgi:DNA polymerase, archaea type
MRVADAAFGEASETCLFGFDNTPGVVAVEVSDAGATLIRAEEQRRVLEQRPFQPWLVAAAEGPLSGSEPPAGYGGQVFREAQWERLSGAGLVWRVRFPHWTAFIEAREQLRIDGIPYLAYSHPVKQFLISSGVTLFKGLSFSSVRRLQVDLETSTLRVNDPDSRILLIAAADNQGNEWVLAGPDERRILSELVELVRQVDPDILEGHNLFGFDLPYLAARAQALRVPLAVGRDGSTLTSGKERNCPIGGITRPFRPAYIWGRHCADTLLAVQRFDVARGELESHGLKEVATRYGIAAPDRVYLDRSQLAQTWQSDPETVRRYALQDVQETRRLAELVLPTEFYQGQMVPESYQNVATGGSGEKINSLLIREYLRQGHSIPQPQPPVACPGGYTEVRRTGVLRHVVKVDAESLYPSIMLHHRIRPAADTLDQFLPMLAELTARRLEAKARTRAGGPDRAYWDGLQSSFKILINSFYGYLGAPFHFNDYQAATQVTTIGQEFVKAVAQELDRTGSQVIEIDTDGVYFTPPPGVETEEEEIAYVERISSALPQGEGIRLAYDGRYAAMVSLKMKNYVLVTYDGRKIIKGSSLRSRGEEAYGREFLARAIECLIQGDLDALAADYEDLSHRITQGLLPVEQFSRRERVTEKTFRSEAKKKSREVARDMEVGDTVVVYRRTDGSLGLAEEYAGDEDRWHYLEKLHRFASRLEEALGEDFARIFPRPNKKAVAAEAAGQLTLF